MRSLVPAAVAACVALLIGTLPAPLAAQGPAERSRVWLGVGLGSGTSSRDEGLALVGELTWQRRPHSLTLRGVTVTDPFSAGAETFGELGVLYGRTHTGRLGHASLSAGLGVTGFDSGCDGRSGGCTVIGVPIVAETALRILPILGLGAQLFANLNAESVYGGFAVFVQVGWLPRRAR